eukprot:Lithocolla_globosa_v1_NODE_1287_length_2699_cov_5.975794.p1 type:complete len:472 gc:universal NODE_1287_length_2699_cov_5.975794:1462-47(-)
MNDLSDPSGLSGLSNLSVDGSRNDTHNFLTRCFFIYDKTAVQNEDDPPEKMILYFYPPDVSLENQLFLIGPVASILEFAKNFTKSSPKVITLEKEKMACKEVGKLTLILTGKVSQSDSSLVNELDYIYEAFCFLFGSFDELQKQSVDSDRPFDALMRTYGHQLVPFIRRPDMGGLSYSSFDHTPYFNLPPSCNRFFLMTSEILKSVKSEPDNLGGCIFYNGSVLCSHLEATTTSFVLVRVESQAAALKGENRENFLISGVFLGHEELKRLRAGRRPLIEPSEELKSQLPDNYFKVLEQGEFVGLYILCLQHISIAVIMNLPAVYDERHANKTRSLVHSKLAALELKLHKASKHMFPEPKTHSFNYLTYDRQTKLLNASCSEPHSETGQRFKVGVRNEHEIFSSHPDASQVILRDTSSVLLGRRIFDKEIYYQQKLTPSVNATSKTLSMNRDLTRLEETARDNLQEVNVSLF